MLKNRPKGDVFVVIFIQLENTGSCILKSNFALTAVPSTVLQSDTFV